MTATLTQVPKDSSALTQNRIVAPIILGITIFFAILFTRPMYQQHIEQNANLSKLESELRILENEYTSLLDVKNNSWTGKIDQELLKKILQKFDRPDIISAIMFNDYTKPLGGIDPRISIWNINVGDPSRLPNWLSLSTVSLWVQGKTVDEIVNYITYITRETPYAFTIENIALPIDTAPEWDIPDGYGMTLSFGLYTYEN